MQDIFQHLREMEQWICLCMPCNVHILYSMSHILVLIISLYTVHDCTVIQVSINVCFLCNCVVNFLMYPWACILSALTTSSIWIKRTQFYLCMPGPLHYITVILPCTVTPGFWLLRLIASYEPQERQAIFNIIFSFDRYQPFSFSMYVFFLIIILIVFLINSMSLKLKMCANSSPCLETLSEYSQWHKPDRSKSTFSVIGNSTKFKWSFLKNERKSIEMGFWRSEIKRLRSICTDSWS